MYAGVPITVPAAVIDCSSERPPVIRGALLARSSAVASSSTASAPCTPRASPKSSTRTRSSAPTMTLSGLKSRCTSPAAWAACSPRPAWMYACRTSDHVRPSCWIHVPSVGPSTSSIATNTASCSTPTSNTGITLGCDSRAIACASRSNRERSSATSNAVTETSLRAMLRSRSGSKAR